MRSDKDKIKVVEHWLPIFNRNMEEFTKWKKEQVCKKIMEAKVHNDVENISKSIVKELDDLMQMHLVFNQVFNPKEQHER